MPLIKPGELDQGLLDLGAQIDDLRDDVDGGGLHWREVRERLAALDNRLMAVADRLNISNPNSDAPGWQSIPDGEPLLGFWSRVPVSECRP